jgi:putative membrane protein
MKRNSRFGLILAAAGLFAGFSLPAQTPSSAPGGGAAGQSGGAGLGSPPMSERAPTGAGAGGPMDSSPMQTRTDDRKFLKDAAMGSMTEVELGKLASEKASSDAVKQFGQKMVEEHGKSAEELKRAAVQMKVNVPDGLDSKHQSRVDKLSKLSGTEFDRAYIKDQVKDHQKDVKDFQDEVQTGTDPNVKSVAAKLLPTLQQHLDAAKDLNKEKTAQK